VALETHRLAFVDSIAASPVVRLEMSGMTQGPFNVRVGTRFDPPPLKRSIPSSLLADGGTPTSASYDNRTIVLQLQPMVNGVAMAADAAAAQMQLLYRELDRPANILRYQAGTTSPVFFRTYRSGPDSVDFDPINKEVTVTLLAEPFAYGLEETQSGTAVLNNPTTGMFLDITSPKGDVDTPLFLNLTGTLGVTGRLVSGLAMRRRGTPSATPFVLQAESMTQGTDTTTQANSASFSGAGNNSSRTTFATVPTSTTRLSTAAFPGSASVDARGTYRVFLRNRKTIAGDTITVQLLWGNSTSGILNDVVTLPSNTSIQYTDLGLVQIPAGYDPVYDGLTGVEIPAAGAYISVSAKRGAGSGNLDTDVLLFMPADDRMEFVKWPASAGGTDIFVLEGGPRPGAYQTTSGGNLISNQPIEIAGGGLMLTPGRTNRLFFARDLGSLVAAAGTSDDLTATTTITPFYYPRYIGGFRPVAT
jgi:hypothetical protein